MRDRQKILGNLESLYREAFQRSEEGGDQAEMARMDFDFQRDQLYLEALLDVRELLAVVDSGMCADNPDLTNALPSTALTCGPAHHWFGYYDKSPWDETGRYVLAMQAPFMDRPPRPDDVAVVGLVDRGRDDAWHPLAETTAWNWQQGCMLQWLPGDARCLAVYNVRYGGGFRAVVRNVFSGRTRMHDLPVYAVSSDGRTAFSANFSRIAVTRPGYGYAGFADQWADDPHPAGDGVHHLDLESGASELVLSLDRAAALDPHESMRGAVHWFNHIQVNTDGSRFACLHRWRRPADATWRTRLLTANPDGGALRNLCDHGMVSHYDWRDARTILAWARLPETGDRYCLIDDATGGADVIGEEVLTKDGHCSWSPDRKWVLTDEYPDEENCRPLLLYRPADGRRVELGRFHSPAELAGEIRCDLHPRWSRDGRRVCFDSAHEGTRQLYMMDVSSVVNGR